VPAQGVSRRSSDSRHEAFNAYGVGNQRFLSLNFRFELNFLNISVWVAGTGSVQIHPIKNICPEFSCE